MAKSIRLEAGLPVSSASDLARKIGLKLRRFSHLPGGRRGIVILGHKQIDIAETTYDPADEFSIAHEIAELHLPEKLEEAKHEVFCDRVAAALLMPELEFLSSCGRTLFQIPRLRQEWPWASYTAIAWRIADICPDIAAARWKKGQLLERRTRSGRGLTEAEQAAVRDANKRGRGFVFGAGAIALAWWLKGRGEKDYAVSLSIRVRS